VGSIPSSGILGPASGNSRLSGHVLFRRNGAGGGCSSLADLQFRRLTLPGLVLLPVADMLFTLVVVFLLKRTGA
jgi:hypothetical protein